VKLQRLATNRLLLTENLQWCRNTQQTKGIEVISAIPGFADEQKRVIAATYGDLRVISVYVPNGDTVVSEKYGYKLRWLPALNEWLQQELKVHSKLAVLGDFNIAPEDRDVYDPEIWEGKVLCSLPERIAFRDLLNLGLVDSFRLFEQPEKSYTWWDYRMMAFRLNRGLRIDHILLSSEIVSACMTCTIDKTTRKQERPSDHAPVIVDLLCEYKNKDLCITGCIDSGELVSA